MKEDLLLKLGDRKRLLHYCRYLAEIHTADRNKKNKKNDAKKNNVAHKRSLPSHLRNKEKIKTKSDRLLNSFKTAVIHE